MVKHRTQLFLDPEQVDALRRIASTEDRSVSAIVRRFVDEGLTRQEEERRHKLDALRRAEELRRELEARHGGKAGDPVAAAREHRSDRQDAVLAGRG